MNATNVQWYDEESNMIDSTQLEVGPDGLYVGTDVEAGDFTALVAALEEANLYEHPDNRSSYFTITFEDLRK